LTALSTLLVADFDNEAPKTVMVDTRAKADHEGGAVCAVRRGLRIEFSRPNFPEIRKARASGLPKVLAMGRATTGASMPMPMKTATAPIPTSWIAGLVSPSARAPTPRTAMIVPMTILRRDDSPCSPGSRRGPPQAGSVRRAAPG